MGPQARCAAAEAATKDARARVAAIEARAKQLEIDAGVRVATAEARAKQAETELEHQRLESEKADIETETWIAAVKQKAVRDGIDAAAKKAQLKKDLRDRVNAMVSLIERM
jgi:hypothetical protein